MVSVDYKEPASDVAVGALELVVEKLSLSTCQITEMSQPTTFAGASESDRVSSACDQARDVPIAKCRLP
jgi:hypothetical protein